MRLGPGAITVFTALQRGEAVGLVPILVLAELHYLSAKQGTPVTTEVMLGLLDRAPSLTLEPLTRRNLQALDQLAGIPEMHDRLIAGVALMHGAAIVTRDPKIRAHPAVQTVW